MIRSVSKERVVKDNRHKLEWSTLLLPWLALSLPLRRKVAWTKEGVAKDNRLKWHGITLHNMLKLPAEGKEGVVKDSR